MSPFSIAFHYNSSGTEWTYIFSRGSKLGAALRWSHTGTFQYYYGNWSSSTTDVPPYTMSNWVVKTVSLGSATTPTE